MFRILILVLLSLLTVRPFPLFAQTGAPLKIGVSLGLTGKYAQLGDMSAKAYKLWEQNINAKSGLLGRPVHLILHDDKSDPAVAREIYRQLIEIEKVDLVFSPYSSEITDAILPVTEKYHYPLLAAGAAADALWQKEYKYLFGLYVPSNKYMVGFLEMLANNNLNNLAMIGADDIFSKDIALGAKEWAKRFGLNVLFFEEFKRGTKSLTTIVRKAQDSKAQALIVFGYMDEAINARLALKEVGWYPSAYYASIGPTLEQFHALLKTDSEHAFSSSQWEPTLPFAGAKDFSDNFYNIYHVMPSYHAASAYAAGQILEAAIKKTRSFDREKIKDALYSLDTMTIMGRYGVDKAGRQIRHFPVIIQWQKDKKEIVYPKELMTATPIWK